MERPRAISGKEFLSHLVKILELDPTRVRRIVLDADVKEVVKVYVECWGDARLLEIRPPNSAEVQIITADKGDA